mgnify:FL=1|tara:strand:+ start:65 stop:649 length:585 start_codon:yes stop_codon:yes gene_type:complete
MPNAPTPIPPVMPLPGAFEVPKSTLAPPSFNVPTWVPIPARLKDIPGPKTRGTKEKSSEEEEEEQKTDREVLDSVQEVMTPLPPLPPYFGTDLEVDSQIEQVELPGGFQVPVPKQEILVTAVATAGAAAVASVGATMVAGNLFKQIVKVAKPTIKIALKKIANLRGKPSAPTWARQRLESRQRIKDKKGWRDAT